MRTSLTIAAAALALFSAPVAGASEISATNSDAESTSFSFYSSFAEDFADEFRCSTSPQRWWCGGRWD